MKKTLFLLLICSLTACTKNKFEHVYLGLNGKFSSVEVTIYNGPNELTFKEKPLGDFMGVEIYTFDNNGYLIERRSYNDPTKKALSERDSYSRDKKGNIIETYSGFNLSNDYISETLWRMLEKDGNKEKWQEIDENDWWGTSYREIEYLSDKKEIKEYIIQKKSGETSNRIATTETYNKRGQMVSQTIDREGNSPIDTKIWTYNDNGHLLKIEGEQLRTDGSVNKTENASYTINKEDEYNNPLQVTDNDGNIKIFKYSYR